MSNSVFFSWQSDTLPKNGKNFIEQALNRAVGAINSELEIQDAERPDSLPLMIDKDTKGVPGSPSIVDTILSKIETSLCFVADLTFVAKRSNKGGVPNPNVMLEYGYAVKALSEKRIVSVMNEASGAPSRENMPFDLAHKRFPITYNLPDDATSEVRKEELGKLSKILETALRGIVEHHLSTQQEEVPQTFSARIPSTGRARFRSPISSETKEGLLGRTESSFHARTRLLNLNDGASMYLRVLPSQPQYRKWTLSDLRRCENGARGFVLLPFQDPTARFNAEDGFGWFSQQIGSESSKEGPIKADSAVIAFANGEVWSIDTSWLSWWSGKIHLGLIVQWFAGKLEDYSSYLKCIGVEPPYTWIAGFEDIDSFLLEWDAPPGKIRVPGYEFPCLTNSIEVEGSFTPGESAQIALRSFFETLCDKCATKPPRHLIPDADSNTGAA